MLKLPSFLLIRTSKTEVHAGCSEFFANVEFLN